MRKLLTIALSCLVVSIGLGQGRQPDASAIQLRIKKLNVLASVLYVAAHPDDENTRAITYMLNDRLAAAAYLSMTRGDGGQNLIGPELRDQLGLIRTQELLAARRIDGGQQFFTRANDFGFSKNVDETFTIWGKEEILSDVVSVYRQFQPDIILTRFPPTERAGHGHHTASAVLAMEAFDLAGKSEYRSDQAARYGLWQPKRVFMNTGRFFDNTLNENTPGVVVVNMGTYNTLLGKSYSEIAAESRTQHKSQGFGSTGRRGDSPEYFQLLKGELAGKDLLDGVNTTWTRLAAGEKVQPLVEQLIREFNSEKPYASVPQLLRIRNQISTLAPSVWKDRKLGEVGQLIQDCLGLYAEISTNQAWMAPGELVTCSFELVNRSPAPVKLLSVSSKKLALDTSMSLELSNNKYISFRTKKTVGPKSGYSDPYWLRENHLQGIFLVPGPEFIGKPDNGPAVTVLCTIETGGEKLVLNVPLVYKWTDPVKGELSRPFEIVPPVFVNLSEPVVIFPDTKPKQVSLLVKSSSSAPINGKASLTLPTGWRSEPTSQVVTIPKRGEEVRVDFTIYPASKGEGTFALMAQVELNGKSYDRAVQTISYDHIPFQTLLPKAGAKLIRADIKKQGQVIGYLAGAGDETPAALRYLGYEVWVMKNEEVTAANLKKVDAVVLGVRVLNTNERIRHFMPDLLAYVQAGGTLISQYNTSGNDFEIDKDKFSPYPMNLSRERVTDENSEVRILAPDHPALNFPNKVTVEDFSGWVQERGLYFPDKWDPKFTPLLSMNDKGEPARDGGLLVAPYGNGYYVYTGLSFFRELPEGVTGAYKLFANLASLGKQPKPKSEKVKSAK